MEELIYCHCHGCYSNFSIYSLSYYFLDYLYKLVLIWVKWYTFQISSKLLNTFLFLFIYKSLSVLQTIYDSNITGLGLKVFRFVELLYLSSFSLIKYDRWLVISKYFLIKSFMIHLCWWYWMIDGFYFESKLNLVVIRIWVFKCPKPLLCINSMLFI